VGLEAVWTARKISLPPGFDPRTVQPVASRYTDRTIPAARTTKKTTLFVYEVLCYWFWLNRRTSLQLEGHTMGTHGPKLQF
jgi:hypothetical protein